VRCLLVVPCFNEAHRWNVGYWAEMLQTPDVDWLFVDDGSSDRTGHLLASLESQPNVNVLSLQANRGKGEAIRAGLLHGRNEDSFQHEFIGFMDADGAFRPSDVERMLRLFAGSTQLREVEALWSSRVALAGRDIRRSRSRHYLGRLVATFLSSSHGELPYDTQSGLKFFRAGEMLQACLETPFATRWMFEIELLIRWRNAAGRPMRVREEPLEYWRDIGGSSIAGREIPRVALELLTIKRLQFVRNP